MRKTSGTLFLAVWFFILLASAFAGDIVLPEPVIASGKPLTRALAERHSLRSFRREHIPPQVLSNLLWASDWFNRNGRRTAPSVHNRQEADVYVA
jgi:hypothetical protein